MDEADAFGLLAHFGGESAGALVLARPGAALAPAGLRPLSLGGAERPHPEPARVPLPRQSPKRMSLAGAQHKMVVVYRDGERGDELYEPEAGAPRRISSSRDSPAKDDYPLR